MRPNKPHVSFSRSLPCVVLYEGDDAFDDVLYADGHDDKAHDARAGFEARNAQNAVQKRGSIEDKKDHIFMHLIESAKFNKGKTKVYLGVPGNLVAFACKVSVDKGYEGFLAFDAKTALIKHYEQSLHATHFRGLRMFIETSAALKLISQYFKS